MCNTSPPWTNDAPMRSVSLLTSTVNVLDSAKRRSGRPLRRYPLASIQARGQQSHWLVSAADLRTCLEATQASGIFASGTATRGRLQRITNHWRQYSIGVDSLLAGNSIPPTTPVDPDQFVTIRTRTSPFVRAVAGVILGLIGEKYAGRKWLPLVEMKQPRLSERNPVLAANPPKILERVKTSRTLVF